MYGQNRAECGECREKVEVEWRAEWTAESQGLWKKSKMIPDLFLDRFLQPFNRF